MICGLTHCTSFTKRSEYSVSFLERIRQTNPNNLIGYDYGIDDVSLNPVRKISILIIFHIPMYPITTDQQEVSVFHQQEVWVRIHMIGEMEFTLSQFQVCPRGRISNSNRCNQEISIQLPLIFSSRIRFSWLFLLLPDHLLWWKRMCTRERNRRDSGLQWNRCFL